MISGIGVFYSTRNPHSVSASFQMLRPTIAGIRPGRDEVLEEAVRQILGAHTPLEKIEKMLRQ